MAFDSQLQLNPAYHLDPDSLIFLRNFSEPRNSVILALGDNQEQTAQTLCDNGYLFVLGVDLQKHWYAPLSYPHVQADFVSFARWLPNHICDCIYSLSALEHFGLGTYPESPIHASYDQIAMEAIWSHLRPEGVCYLTVPYGKDFIVAGKDWRVYNARALKERIIRRFTVEQEIFFKSADPADCPDLGGDIRLVEKKHADQYSGDPPHLTIYLKLRKVI